MASESPSRLQRIAASRRTLVIGPSGSGKTLFSRGLAGIAGLDLIHLDAEFWQPGWIPTPRDRWRARVAELAARSTWIMDGTYEATLDLRLPAAECVILVRSGRIACLWRVIKRILLANGRRREDAPPGQRLDRAFFRYIWDYPKIILPQVEYALQRYAPESAVILILNGPGECRQLLRELRTVPDKYGTCGG